MLTQAVRGLARLASARHAPVKTGRGTADIQLQRRFLYILPTREGIYYGGVLAVMLLAAINYANGLAYALTFMLAAIGILAILHTHRNLVGLRLSAGPAPPVFAGESALFAVIVHNDADAARLALDMSVGNRTHRFDVPAGGATSIALAVPAARRGYLDAPPVRLRTRFPLGLWNAWSRPLGLAARCLVYPHPAAARAFPETPDVLSGQELGRNVEGEDFTGLREFRHGDPVQRVAWKKVAAGQGWHTKQFSAPASRLVWLEWDALSGLEVEERLSLLCRWVLVAEQQGLAYGLRLPGLALAPATGAAHRDRCLERLALFDSHD